jgi:hypothetical protein
MRRVLVAVAAALVVLAMAPVAHAGEITGNGKSLHVDGKWGTGLHSRSVCAFSGQEDLQFLTPMAIDPTGSGCQGVPGHAQSWGQIPKAVRQLPRRDTSGMACNPIRASSVRHHDPREGGAPDPPSSAPSA